MLRAYAKDHCMFKLFGKWRIFLAYAQILCTRWKSSLWIVWMCNVCARFRNVLDFFFEFICECCFLFSLSLFLVETVVLFDFIQLDVFNFTFTGGDACNRFINLTMRTLNLFASFMMTCLFHLCKHTCVCVCALVFVQTCFKYCGIIVYTNQRDQYILAEIYAIIPYINKIYIMQVLASTFVALNIWNVLLV